jgi:hypothetical protein
MTTSEGGDDFAEHLGVKLPCVNELGFLVACFTALYLSRKIGRLQLE